MVVAPLLAYLLATADLSQAAPRAPANSAPLASFPATPTKKSNPGYLMALGLVTATTVDVRARVDGRLTSIGLVEGRSVKVGQLLASIESPRLRAQLDRATNHLSQDRKLQAEAAIPADEAAVAEARRLLADTQVRAPISGVAGLRKVDPGNLVHAGDTLLVITQVHPIAVVFRISEDDLPRVQALLRSGATPAVELWNRKGGTVRLATGRLTAIDNEIDPVTGTVRLKARVDNNDGTLFPNQVVNVRLLVSAR